VLTIAALLLVVVVESLLFAQAMHHGTGGRWILPLDDAYIHQQYAVQAARGHPFQYDDQAPPSSGATSLLYPFIMAAAWRLGFQGDLLSAFAFGLGGVCLALSALLMVRLGRRIHERLGPAAGGVPAAWVGLLAALLVLSNGALLWGFLSGMEGGLFIVLLLATLDAFVEQRPGRVALFGGLLALTRPEALILAGLLLAGAAVQRLWQKDACGRWSWWYVLPPALGLLQPMLNLALTGSTTSNGMRAKSWLYNVPTWPASIMQSIAKTAAEVWATFLMGLAPENAGATVAPLVRAPSQALLYMPPLVALAGLAFLGLQALRDARRRCFGWAALLLLWIVAGLSATATMGTAQWHFERYQLPFFVLALLAGALALAQLAAHAGRQQRSHMAFVALSLLAVAASALSLPGFVWRYGEATRTTLNQQVRLGEWVRANLPAGAVVGVHDAGAIRYYGRHPIYDLVGLAAPPENSLAWRNGSGSIYELMERSPHPPDYFAIYNDVWALPYFVGTQVFQKELFAVEAADMAGVVAASDRQFIYAADWRLWNSGDCPYQQDVLDRVAGMQLVDSLDVADLAGEAAHSYVWWQSQRKAGFPSDAFQLTYYLSPNQEVMDGGRLITGGEAFDLTTSPGQEALLVGRFLGQSAVRLQVKVNGRPLGPWGYAPIPGRWQEQALEIPAEYITGTRTHVEIDVDAAQPDLEFHRPFYYWCYQGTPVEEAPAIAHPLNAQVGDGIALLGYSLQHTVTPSAYQLDLDLYWQAVAPVTGDYKVFVHWSDEQDTILTQQDNRPWNDLRPTWAWRPGATVVDHYSLTLSLDAPLPAETVLSVGMYDSQTGQRLPIAGGDSAHRLELERILLP